jgi:hypothetical protein
VKSVFLVLASFASFASKTGRRKRSPRSPTEEEHEKEEHEEEEHEEEENDYATNEKLCAFQPTCRLWAASLLPCLVLCGSVTISMTRE